MSYNSDKMLDDSRGGDPRYETPEIERMSAGRYAATRFSTLKPPMNKAPNPFKLLAMLNFQQWMFFLVAFLAWSWDAFDFFTVSLTVTELAKEFGKENSQITWGITLVLMFRSVGSVIFGEPSHRPMPANMLTSEPGIAADRYGRKWPFIVNNILFIVLELGTGFCQTYRQFLACRALFGIAMVRTFRSLLSCVVPCLGSQDKSRGSTPTLVTRSNADADICAGRSIRKRRSNSTRRLSRSSTRSHIRDVTTRLRIWLPPRRSIRSRPGRHHIPRLAPPFLVRSLPTRPHHPLPPMPAGDGFIQRARCSTQSQR